jgi:hypothetical protein
VAIRPQHLRHRRVDRGLLCLGSACRLGLGERLAVLLKTIGFEIQLEDAPIPAEVVVGVMLKRAAVLGQDQEVVSSRELMLGMRFLPEPLESTGWRGSSRLKYSRANAR